jgi:hypothetical protein
LCEVVAGCNVLCISIPKCCFDALELLSLNLPCSSPMSESLYLSNQSNITHLFKNSVNHSSGFVGWLEDLEVVIAKCTAVIEGRLWFWFSMEVMAVDWSVITHCSFDMWVLSNEVVPYPLAELCCLVFVIPDEEDLWHGRFGFGEVQCPS